MKTRAVRMYGKKDLRLDTVELPQIKEDEILVEIISDSLCMSSYKAAIQGSDHKRVPADIAQNPVMIGHEFCGRIVEVGEKWKDIAKPGQKFTIQPNFSIEGSLASPGYSYPYCGGDSQYAILPPECMERGCLLAYEPDVFYYGSIAEPMSCIVGGFHANYHTKPGIYKHEMGIKEGGKMALLAGVGPMGLGAIDYALHCDRRPSLLVVTDINQERLDRAASIYTVEHAKEIGIELHYLNTSENAVEKLMELSGGTGYDDVFVYAPVAAVVEQGDKILGYDGCLNFFAGPTNAQFTAAFNFYDVHYAAHHIVGTSGGNIDDIRESLSMMASGKINPSSMITHVGGLNAVVDATLNLPNIPGGKKLIYTHIEMPLTAIADFEELGKTDPMFKELHQICERHNGLWNGEAEQYLLAHAKQNEQ